jgi:hypothetical protein
VDRSQPTGESTVRFEVHQEREINMFMFENLVRGNNIIIKYGHILRVVMRQCITFVFIIPFGVFSLIFNDITSSLRSIYIFWLIYSMVIFILLYILFD